MKHSFLGKYSYQKVPDRKHSGRQQDLKALRSKQRYQTLYADWDQDIRKGMISEVRSRIYKHKQIRTSYNATCHKNAETFQYNKIIMSYKSFDVLDVSDEHYDDDKANVTFKRQSVNKKKQKKVFA